MVKLKYKTNASVPKLGEVRASEAGDVLTLVEDPALGRQVQRTHQVE